MAIAMDILAHEGVMYLYSFSEFITLPGKDVGGLRIHPIFEISLVGAYGGGIAKIVPAALIVECQGEILTFLMENINMSDEQSAG